ncbi:hypothetical protein HNQ02_002574 [Flavobacterium sp. 7E]|uniref:DUF1287 domain-containing protein n=1 Tax=unclassified Flavobacterium TaxID=196869 RepID=UPI00156F45C7|nr:MULTISPECIES: DUF1287 domain-containing protein [unclassified Flavobacterium]NRS89643.1 hypothetical protein [Flavobacterium sp. 7E]NRT15036.1 hypothetical protein [Flavobacterium sp. 28A]
MKFLVAVITFLSVCSCGQKQEIKTPLIAENVIINTFEQKLSDAALSIINPSIVYDPSYFSIKYPNGDIAANKGVCTDVVIRAYRKLNIDLQKEVHEDMKANFSKYPNLVKWGMTKTDTNIDHRRVPNLEVFFDRKGEHLPINQDPSTYKTGEIITWMINGKLPHIGIITNQKSADGKRNLIVHNIGGGQVLADCLFDFEIVGHYKYQK